MNWKTVTLSEAVGDGVFIDGDWVESKDQDPNGDVRLIQLADVGINKFVDKSNRFMTSDAAKRLRCTMLEAGDVLVARMPDPIGRACIFPGDSKPCATVVDVCIVRPDTEISDPRFLAHLFNSIPFQQKVAGYITGTTRQRISRGNLNKIPFPLPPLAEQQRIAARLDAADRLRALRRDALARLDALTHALFLEMFGDPAHNPKDWPVVKLGELTKIRRGASPRPIDDFMGGDVNWIKIGDGTKGSDIYLEKCAAKVTQAGADKSVYLKSGSLIFANCGVSLGFARILRVDGCIHDGWLALEDVSPQLDKLFLLKALNAMTQHFRDMAPDGTQPNLNTSIMKTLDFPLPPLSLQREFASRLGQIETVRARMEESRVGLDALFASLQSAAFEGV